MTPLRVLPYREASGPVNMALDEAILEAVARAEAPPTLRAYGWRGRWLSIGMAQSIANVDLPACAAAGVRVLRRPSGGTAVLHVEQFAWSLTLPLNHALAPPDVVASYAVHAAIALDWCARVGIAGARAATLPEARAPLPDPQLRATCFGALAPHEVLLDGRKLIGWGQVRRRGVVLHHAVLARRFDPTALGALLVVPDRPRLGAALAARVTALPPTAPAPEQLAAALDAAHAISSTPGQLTPAERRRAADLVRTKYARHDWTDRR